VAIFLQPYGIEIFVIPFMPVDCWGLRFLLFASLCSLQMKNISYSFCLIVRIGLSSVCVHEPFPFLCIFFRLSAHFICMLCLLVFSPCVRFLMYGYYSLTDCAFIRTRWVCVLYHYGRKVWLLEFFIIYMEWVFFP